MRNVRGARGGAPRRSLRGDSSLRTNNLRHSWSWIKRDYILKTHIFLSRFEGAIRLILLRPHVAVGRRRESRRPLRGDTPCPPLPETSWPTCRS